MAKTRESYRITVRGRLSDRFAAALGRLTPEPGGLDTALVGELDDGELDALLDRLNNLGLEIVEVRGASG
jgi:arginase family enzyme